MPTEVRIDSLRLDGGTQPREQLDEQTVEKYSIAMEDAAEFPPIVVYYDGTDNWLADGFHRARAAEEVGWRTISADVRQGTQRDAILHSVGANSRHGLPRSNEDKRRAVMRLLDDREWRELSDRRIAEICDVSHTFVAKLRKKDEKPAPKEEPATEPEQAPEVATPDDSGNVATEEPQQPTTPEPVPQMPPVDVPDHEPIGDNSGVRPSVRTQLAEVEHFLQFIFRAGSEEEQELVRSSIQAVVDVFVSKA